MLIVLTQMEDKMRHIIEIKESGKKKYIIKLPDGTTEEECKEFCKKLEAVKKDKGKLIILANADVFEL